MQPPHGFSTGQRVEVLAGRYDGPLPRGPYTILRLLPNDSADREYRVRNEADGHERVVRQSQLRAEPGAPER